jgi:hypothetical protein
MMATTRNGMRGSHSSKCLMGHKACSRNTWCMSYANFWSVAMVRTKKAQREFLTSGILTLILMVDNVVADLDTCICAYPRDSVRETRRLIGWRLGQGLSFKCQGFLLPHP